MVGTLRFKVLGGNAQSKPYTRFGQVQRWEEERCTGDADAAPYAPGFGTINYVQGLEVGFSAFKYAHVFRHIFQRHVWGLRAGVSGCWGVLRKLV